MASIRMKTNVSITESTTNNYVTIDRIPAGNLAGVTLQLRVTKNNEGTYDQFSGASAIFNKMKMTMDGQVIFDETVCSDPTNDSEAGFDYVDVIRTVLDGESTVQYTRRYLTADTSAFGETQFPLMLSLGSETSLQLEYDTNAFANIVGAGAVTAIVFDVVLDYVDVLTGTYTLRHLARESSPPTSGFTYKQIPQVDGYALEAIYLRSSNPSSNNVKTDQFTVSSRISMTDFNGNVFLGEKSGIEYADAQQQKYGFIENIATTAAAEIQTQPPMMPVSHLNGVIVLDALQFVGQGMLKLQPDVASMNLDIMCIYVRRNSSLSTASQGSQLSTSVDSIGSGQTDQPAIQ